MNRILFCGLFCLYAQWAAAQVYVNDVDVNAQPITYCQLSGWAMMNRTEGRVWLDYGQPSNKQPNGLRPQYFKGPDKKSVVFNSIVDALNFMTGNGWDLVSMHAVTDDDGDVRYIYLLRRKLS